MKTVQNNSCRKNWHETTCLCVVVMKSKRQVEGKLGHVVNVDDCRLS